jgi:hypothetical protein
VRFLAAILACLVAAYALSFWLTIPANPEVRFWRDVVARRDAEIAHVRKEQPDTPIIFFTGGSSCAFSIDPKIIEETCGMPAFNLGLPVSAGPKYLLHQALAKCRKGDLLVVCLEPDELTYDSYFAPTSFTFALALLDGDPAATHGGTSFGGRLSLRDYLNYSRPGPRYITTWIAKAATGKGYRYMTRDIRYHGHIETQVSAPSLPLAGPKAVTQVHPVGRQLLETFKTAAKRKGVRLIYSMPWMLTAAHAAEQNRAANLKILESIRSIIPSFDDGYQGVALDPALFSDSGLHLSAAGSKLRSIALAESLRALLTVERAKSASEH